MRVVCWTNVRFLMSLASNVYLPSYGNETFFSVNHLSSRKKIQDDVPEST